jgi:hypothetical protein
MPGTIKRESEIVKAVEGCWLLGFSFQQLEALSYREIRSAEILRS